MRRVHLEPSIGALPLERVTTARVEALASEMLAAGLSPEDRAQRPDVRPLRIRACDRQGLVSGEPAAPRRASQAPAGRRRQPRPAGPLRARARSRPSRHPRRARATNAGADTTRAPRSEE